MHSHPDIFLKKRVKDTTKQELYHSSLKINTSIHGCAQRKWINFKWVRQRGWTDEKKWKPLIIGNQVFKRLSYLEFCINWFNNLKYLLGHWLCSILINFPNVLNRMPLVDGVQQKFFLRLKEKNYSCKRILKTFFFLLFYFFILFILTE